MRPIVDAVAWSVCVCVFACVRACVCVQVRVCLGLLVTDHYCCQSGWTDRGVVQNVDLQGLGPGDHASVGGSDVPAGRGGHLCESYLGVPSRRYHCAGCHHQSDADSRLLGGLRVWRE